MLLKANERLVHFKLKESSVLIPEQVNEFRAYEIIYSPKQKNIEDVVVITVIEYVCQ